MKMLAVTRKRAASLLNDEALRALMRGDTEALVQWMPLFVAEDGLYVGRDAGRAWIGAMTIREFGKTAAVFIDQIAVTPQERKDIAFAFKNNAPTLPEWIRVLDASKMWGTPPWVVAEDDQKQLWFRRFSVVESIKASVKK